MTDSASTTSMLANAGYMIVENATYERLREMASDWVYAQRQYTKCARCPNYDDADLMVEGDDGQDICWECVRELAEQRVEEDDDAGVERLFAVIRKVTE